MSEYFAELPDEAPEESFERLCWIMEKLLGPDGCPWDREQTHESLKQYLIEEAYEVHEAIETGNPDHLREELGDVALQVVFHAALARQSGRFTIEEVLDGISEKLVRRHPHVFGQTKVDGSGQVLENWEQIKKKERASKKSDDSMLAGVPRSLPALQKAHRMQNKVRRVGFDWPEVDGAIDKVHEEFDELAQAAKHPEGDGPTDEQIDEFGDVLFSMVNVGRIIGIQSEDALQRTCGKFAKRFRYLEQKAVEDGRKLEEMTLEEMDVYWEEAKKMDAQSAFKQ